jgi:hypothetical protein
MYANQNPMVAFKEEQKRIAAQIREYKDQRPMKNRGRWNLWELEEMIKKLSWTYRHRHIAYSLMRGRKLEEIESKTTPNNKRNDKLFGHYYRALELDVLCWRRIKKLEYKLRQRNETVEVPVTEEAA